MTFTDLEWKAVIGLIAKKEENAIEGKYPTARWWNSIKLKARALRAGDRPTRQAETILSRLILEFPGIISDTPTDGADVISRLAALIDENPEIKEFLEITAGIVTEEREA